MRTAVFAGALLIAAAAPSTVKAQAASDAALAEKLANPISSLISVPFQYNTIAASVHSTPSAISSTSSQ